MDYVVDSPYPELPKQSGVVSQLEYFREPSEPIVGDIGTQKAFLSHKSGESSGFPAGFGTGYRVYHSTRFDGFKHKLYFVRRDQGSIDHGVRRTNGDAYELAKFNKILYPGEYEKNSCLYHQNGDWKDMPEDLQRMLKLATWPLVFGAPTIAPFVKSKFGFSARAAEQPNLLAKMCMTPEIFQMVLGNLVDSWESVSNLGRTSQLLFETIGSSFMHCDLTTGDFLDIDKSEDTLRRLVINGRRTRDETKDVAVSPFVIVSPMRRMVNEETLSRDGRLNAWGYEDNGDMLFNQPDFSRAMDYSLKLFKAIRHRPEQFQHLLLQRVPYLNIFAVRAIVRSLPNLKTIGIHNCELMTFGNTSTLIEVVRYVNRDRAAHGITTRLNLDFYPRYFQGPITGSLGCFGAVPHDEGTLEIHKSVVATLLHVIPMATAAGIDLLKPGKAFRRWLDKLPLHLDTLPCILEAIMNLISYRNGAYGDVSSFDAQTKCNMEMTLWVDIIVATNGAPMREEVLKPTMISELKENEVILYSCRDCGEELPRWFFREDYADRRDEYRVCRGCQLVWFLNQHAYNMHRRKRDIANMLWESGLILDVPTLMGGPIQLNNNGTLAAAMHNLPAPGAPAINHRLRQARRWARTFNRAYFQDQRQVGYLENRVRLLRIQRDSFVGGSPEMWQNDADLELAKQQLTMLRIRVGRGQFAPDPQRELALSWQKLIDSFRSVVAMGTGQLVNKGPRPTLNTAAFGVDCVGF